MKVFITFTSGSHQSSSKSSQLRGVSQPEGVLTETSLLPSSVLHWLHTSKSLVGTLLHAPPLSLHSCGCKSAALGNAGDTGESALRGINSDGKAHRRTNSLKLKGELPSR